MFYLDQRGETHNAKQAPREEAEEEKMWGELDGLG